MCNRSTLFAHETGFQTGDCGFSEKQNISKLGKLESTSTFRFTQSCVTINDSLMLCFGIRTIITARKRSLRRLCFYTCMSVILFTGGGLHRGVCIQEGLHSEGNLLRRGVYIQGGLHPGGLPRGSASGGSASRGVCPGGSAFMEGSTSRGSA